MVPSHVTAAEAACPLQEPRALPPDARSVIRQSAAAVILTPSRTLSSTPSPLGLISGVSALRLAATAVPTRRATFARIAGRRA